MLKYCFLKLIFYSNISYSLHLTQYGKKLYVLSQIMGSKFCYSLAVLTPQFH